ncbi:tRNA1(Val) (adenine(37)-N6)-methyltransferase [Marinilabilia salmonicolor]|nr:methyltransferase [Marinilabilia salmonicolor]
MKVGTDGVLLGAWTPVDLQPAKILDAGTGTGLVALMLAQRTRNAMIDAVEIDDAACVDARINFEASPWNDRLNLYHASLQDFAENSASSYDLIVSNPPFFSGSMKNECSRKATARHDVSLTAEDLLEGVNKLLSVDGVFSLILPVYDYESFRLKAACSGMYEQKRLMVHPNPGKPAKRVLSVWTRKQVNLPIIESLDVEESRHKYTPGFKNIVSGFYLAF